jgi:hypothetical protein
MILNIIGILILGGLVYYAVNTTQQQPNNSVPFFNDVNKSRSLVNKNSDSSMYTELLRRQTIKRVGRVKPEFIKETKYQFGSFTGYLETFMITGIGSLPIQNETIICPPNVIYDGGNEFSEFCPIPGSGLLDGGNQGTKTCESCPNDVLFDGGNETNNFNTIIGSGILDGGNENTVVCGV